jgi:Fic family protein
MNTTTTFAAECCTVLVFKTASDRSLARRIRRDFTDMPGMRLTVEQAMRLWTVNHDAATRVLDALVAERYLELDDTGRYARAHRVPALTEA